MIPKMIALLLLGTVAALTTNNAETQDVTGKPKHETRWVFRKSTSLVSRSDQVCFSSCKYKGTSSTYIGIAEKDDESCSTACGKAEQKCKDNDDGPCQYVRDSCKYTTCN